MPSGRGRERGLAYLMLILAIAIVGAATASSVTIGARRARADAEDALLAVGAEFEQALTSYRGRGSASMAGGGPKTFDDLLKDPRVPGIKRHLRQLRADPLTGRTEWGVLRHPDGSMAGIYSLAPGQPGKETGFALHQGRFEKAGTYAQWVFTALPEQGVPPVAVRVPAAVPSRP